MKKYIVLALWAFVALGLGSCQSKSSRIDNLKDFVEEISEDGKDYTWEKANKKFSELLEKINSYDDLSQEELEEVARLQGQYAATVFKNSGKAIMEQMEKAGTLLDGFFEGAQEELKK